MGNLLPEYKSQHPHNRQALTTAYQMLTAGRALLHMAESGSFEPILSAIKYHIIAQLNNDKYLSLEQIKRTIDYAANKTTIGQSKIQFSQQTLFFKSVKRDRNEETTDVCEAISTKKQCLI